MAETSKEEVRRIAALARLEVTDAEAHDFTAQFERILGQFRALAELDIVGVEPTEGAQGVFDVRRPDEPRPGLAAQDVLALAPDRDEEFFRVPRAFGDEA
jgi:aspartyl-tRNA(Asn)/glutamyl-tRNA(Gln) amidotransferase subunit C